MGKAARLNITLNTIQKRTFRIASINNKQDFAKKQCKDGLYKKSNNEGIRLGMKETQTLVFW